MAHLKNCMHFILVKEYDTNGEEARDETGDVVRDKITKSFSSMQRVQKLIDHLPP